MKPRLHFLLAAACLAVLSHTATVAQTTRKPAPKPAPKPVARPAAKPAPKASGATKAPAAAPAPAVRPASTSAAAATVGPFGVGTNVLNLGIGLGSRYTYVGNASFSPAYNLSFERGILPLGPGILGVGAFVGYQSTSYEFLGFQSKYTDVIVTLRGAFHYPVSKELDAYGGLSVGVRRLGYTTNLTGLGYVDYGGTFGTSALFLGARYFFAERIGAFAEIGYDQTYLKAGLAAKF